MVAYDGNRGPEPSLLLSRLQIRHECLPIFYSNTRFEIHSGTLDLSHGAAWLRSVGASQAHRLYQVEIYARTFAWAKASNAIPFLDAMRVTGLRPSQLYIWYAPRGWLTRRARRIVPENALESFFQLGVWAHDYGWTEDELYEHAEDWLAAKAAGWYELREFEATLHKTSDDDSPREAVVSTARKEGKFGLRQRASAQADAKTGEDMIAEE